MYRKMEAPVLTGYSRVSPGAGGGKCAPPHSAAARYVGLHDINVRVRGEKDPEAFREQAQSFSARVRETALNLVFPRRCPVCDRPVRPSGALICPDCEKMLVRVQAPVCRRCGKPLRSAAQQLCRDCSASPRTIPHASPRAAAHIYERGCAVFTYHSAAGGIFRFKYGGRQEYGAYYGQCMARKLKEETQAHFPVPDCLVPVPLSPHRLEKRGYNQALILAQEMSRRTGIPVRTDLLVRVAETRPMKNMGAGERQNNLKKAFKAYGNDVELNSTMLKSFMLIDDIYTTGATIDACAHALYGLGAGRVFFMALAIGEDIP